MKEQSSSSEVLENHIKILGIEFGKIYNACWNDVGWLHLKWQQYKELYMVSQEQIDILSRVAGSFFKVVQDVLLDDILLHICRLIEFEKKGGKSRLSLRRFIRFTRNTDIHDKLKSEIDALTKLVTPAVDRRNRLIAHKSFDLVIDENLHPLSEITYKDIAQMISSIDRMINIIEDKMFDSSTDFTVLTSGSGASLVSFIKKNITNPNPIKI
jgi:hypothetical protein